MKITRCDNHPDREAVTTVAIRVLPLGHRPLFGYIGQPYRLFDLCEECSSSIPFESDEEDKHEEVEIEEAEVDIEKVEIDASET